MASFKIKIAIVEYPPPKTKTKQNRAVGAEKNSCKLKKSHSPNTFLIAHPLLFITTYEVSLISSSLRRLLRGVTTHRLLWGTLQG